MKLKAVIIPIIALVLSGCAGVSGALQPFSQETLANDAKTAKTNTDNAFYQDAPKVTQITKTKVVDAEPQKYNQVPAPPSEPKKKFGLPKLSLPHLGDNKQNNYGQNAPQGGNSVSNTDISNASSAMPIIEQTNVNIDENVDYQYKLGSGDKVRIIVYGEENLSGEFYVTGEGRMSLPLIGEVNARGLTVTELQDRIANKLAQGYLKYPRVSAEVLNFRPFYILGEVNKPGMYPYSSGLTLENAVAMGGGFTYRAEKRKFFIRHENQAGELSISAGGSIIIQPGDTIRISERYF